MNTLFLGCSIFLIIAFSNVDALPQWYAQFTASRPHDQSSVKVCGREAEAFMHWFCDDTTFILPYESHLSAIIKRQKLLGNPDTNPFHYQAVKCCRHSCKAREFRWMCSYHKKYTACKENHSNSTHVCHNKVIIEMGSLH